MEGLLEAAVSHVTSSLTGDELVGADGSRSPASFPSPLKHTGDRAASQLSMRRMLLGLALAAGDCHVHSAALPTLMSVVRLISLQTIGRTVIPPIDDSASDEAPRTVP